MEKSEIKFCRFCLTIISNGNFKEIGEIVKEVLDVLLLKLNLEENYELVMCNACSMKLFAAFHFKVTCIDTEDSIFPYVDSENVTPVDLREIYLKLRGKEHLINIQGDQRICRLCMQLITNEFTSVGEIEVEVILKYIPEIKFNNTKDPVICSKCLDSFNTHSDFIKNCLDLEKTCLDMDEKIKNVMKCAIEIPVYTKSENIEIKTEDYDEYGDTSLQGSTIILDDKINSSDSTSLCELKPETSSNIQVSKSKARSFKTKRGYMCDVCEFKTKFKGCLTNHRRSHENSLKEPKYQCDICSFTYKHKSHLIIHQLKHKNLSEVQAYKCDLCDFASKYKSSLTKHLLNHKDFSEVPLYICEVCDFTTKHKHNLSNHQTIHNDKVKMYKCDTCDYRTNRKSYLTLHELRHKDISEVRLYKCDACGFETKYKTSFRMHQLKHKSFSDVRVYKCDTCVYETKFRHCMIRHQIRHINTLQKCEI